MRRANNRYSLGHTSLSGLSGLVGSPAGRDGRCYYVYSLLVERREDLLGRRAHTRALAWRRSILDADRVLVVSCTWKQRLADDYGVVLRNTGELMRRNSLVLNPGVVDVCVLEPETDWSTDDIASLKRRLGPADPVIDLRRMMALRMGIDPRAVQQPQQRGGPGRARRDEHHIRLGRRRDQAQDIGAAASADDRRQVEIDLVELADPGAQQGVVGGAGHVLARDVLQLLEVEAGRGLRAASRGGG